VTPVSAVFLRRTVKRPLGQITSDVAEKAGNSLGDQQQQKPKQEPNKKQKAPIRRDPLNPE
jgi:hypothetical protein